MQIALLFLFWETEIRIGRAINLVLLNVIIIGLQEISILLRIKDSF